MPVSTHPHEPSFIDERFGMSAPVSATKWPDSEPLSYDLTGQLAATPTLTMPAVHPHSLFTSMPATVSSDGSLLFDPSTSSQSVGAYWFGSGRCSYFARQTLKSNCRI